MSTVLQYDEEASRRVEAIYSTPDVVAVRREVLSMLQLDAGEHILDIGSGPGFLALEMARAVFPGGSVVGIDVSAAMLAMAQARLAVDPLDVQVNFEQADARHLPYPDNRFDVAVATQTFEYVDDLPAAFAELFRVVRPGGRVLILDTDWDSIVWHSSDRARMERVLAVWNQHLANPFLPRTMRHQLEHAGFRTWDQAVIPLFNPESAPETYSQLVVGLIENFVRSQGDVPAAEVDEWTKDLHGLEAAGTTYFSLNRYVVIAVKPVV